MVFTIFYRLFQYIETPVILQLERFTEGFEKGGGSFYLALKLMSSDEEKLSI